MIRNDSARQRTSALLIAAAVLVVGCAPANADVIRAFNVSGVFVNGTTLSGSIAIDTTNGTLSSVNLTLGSPINSIFNSSTIVSAQLTAASPISLLDLIKPLKEKLSLFIDAASFVDYSGRALCGGPVGGPFAPSPCNNVSAWISSFPSEFFDTLTSGSITQAPPPTILK